MAAEPLLSEQERFLSAVFGREQGYLFISTKNRTRENDWHDQSFVYPLQVNEILQFVKQQDDAGLDVYMAAQLYKEPNRRIAKNVKLCPSAWSDLDTACPWGIDPEPNVVLETSPGRWHGFWRTVIPMPAAEAEEVSRQIAYAHHRAGADLGGWDLTQVLRIPGTHNHKPEYPDCPVVLLKRCDPKPIPRSAFSVLPAAPKKHEGAGATPDDDGAAPITLQGFELEHWQKEVVPDRSAWAMRMVGILKDNGLSDRLVEVALANHPIYLAKAREKWGNKESLIYDDIRRCLQRWRETRGPSVDFDEEIRPAGAAPVPLDTIPDSEAEAEGWRVFDAADFLAMEYPVVQWRIQGFLRDRAILFNFGAPGSIKTYIATDGAIAVSTGGLFLGEYPCEQGRVLIVQEDTLDSDFQQAYLGPMVRARGIDPEELRGHLFVAPPGGMTLGIPERVKELCAWLEEYKPDLLILDAFYLMHDGEGYGKDLVPIMKRLKAIRGLYGCAIWVIDHDRKGKAEGSNSENPIDRLWGGRQKSAAVDAIMESRPIKGSHGETFLDLIKLRGAKPDDPIRVKLYPDYRLLIEGEGEDEEASPEGTRLAVYEWLCREGGSRTKAQISAGVDLSLRSIEGSLYDLYRDGLAKKVGKVGRAETWIALRKGEAEPVADGPNFDWDEEE